MWKTITAVGASAVIIGGAGTAAYAASGTAAPAAPSASSTSATSDGATTLTTEAGQGAETGKQAVRNRIRNAVHASWVTQDKKARTFTTHEAIRGQVTSVSPTSITVRSADNVTETFVVSPTTKVWTRTVRTAAARAAAKAAAQGTPAARTPAPRTAASIADVATGDTVFVGGTGTTALTAIRIMDVKR